MNKHCATENSALQSEISVDFLSVIPHTPRTMKWFRYGQNNSGGHMEQNEQVSVHVLIEAHSGKEADGIAEDIGIYFDGVEAGSDCECCGDRWNPCKGYAGEDFPNVYGKDPSEYGEAVVRIYPYKARKPVSIADFQKNLPMVIEPS